jgi:hypothetical protein
MPKSPPPKYAPTNEASGSKYHRPSSMPIIKSFDAPPSYKPGSISRRPEPTLTGRGEKRAK